jgi:hypothetical protein
MTWTLNNDAAWMTTRMVDGNVATTEDDADVDDGAAHHGGQMSTPMTNADAAEGGQRSSTPGEVNTLSKHTDSGYTCK